MPVTRVEHGVFPEPSMLFEARANGRTFTADELVFHRRLLLIDGLSCSGKTTLAQILADRLNGLAISGDNWALPERRIRAAADRLDLESPSSYDLAGLVTCIRALLTRGRGSVPHFDFKADRVLRRSKMSMTGRSILIIEFIHALSAFVVNGVEEFQPTTLYVKTDPCVCLLRRIKRDTCTRGKTLQRSLSEIELINWQDEKVKENRAEFVFNGTGTHTEMSGLISYFQSQEATLHSLSGEIGKIVAVVNNCAEKIRTRATRLKELNN